MKKLILSLLIMIISTNVHAEILTVKDDENIIKYVAEVNSKYNIETEQKRVYGAYFSNEESQEIFDGDKLLVSKLLEKDKLFRIYDKLLVENKSDNIVIIALNDQSFRKNRVYFRKDEYKILKVTDNIEEKHLVVSTIPKKYETNVKLNENITINLEEKIKFIDKDKIYILTGDGESAEIKEFYYIPDYNKLIVEPKLKAGLGHTVVFEAGALITEEGNKNIKYTSIFYTKDAKPLKIEKVNVSKTRLVDTNKKIEITFNKNIKKLDGRYLFRNLNYVMGVKEFEVEGNKLTITPKYLRSNFNYLINVPSKALEDVDGLSNEEFEISFRTKPMPVVINSYPAEDMEDVNLDSGIAIIFDGKIEEFDLSKVNVLENGEEVKFTATPLEDRKIILIDNINLKSNKTYKVNVLKGAANAADGYINHEHSFEFKTLDFYDYTNLEGFYGRNDILSFVNKGYYIDYKNHEFAKNEELTKLEYAELLSKVLKLERKYTDKSMFVDIPFSDEKLVYAVTAKDYLAIEGNTFRPDEKVTKKDFVTNLEMAYGKKLNLTSDLSSKNITKAEAVIILNRFLNKTSHE
ncbi:MAG: Ig-like domain-containing protein [Clostridia bacterium]|nr:Ig-like domain-containing protein [Clostridia bacterium]